MEPLIIKLSRKNDVNKIPASILCKDSDTADELNLRPVSAFGDILNHGKTKITEVRRETTDDN
jgi:hypothetical protein